MGVVVELDVVEGGGTVEVDVEEVVLDTTDVDVTLVGATEPSHAATSTKAAASSTAGLEPRNMRFLLRHHRTQRHSTPQTGRPSLARVPTADKMMTISIDQEE